LSRPEGRDLAQVLTRKAEGDAKAMRRLASDPEIDDEAVGFHAQQAIEKWLKAVMALHGLEEARNAGWLDELTIYAVPLRYADLLDAEPLERDKAITLVAEVGEWASAYLRAADE
jgi:hypothetical protein